MMKDMHRFRDKKENTHLATRFFPHSLLHDGTPTIAFVLVSASHTDDKKFVKSHKNDKELENICVIEGLRSSDPFNLLKGGRYRHIAYKYL